MLSRTHKKEFQILKRQTLTTDKGGTERVVYVPQEALYGVITGVGSVDIQLADSDVLSRQKRVRTFEKVDVNYDDKIRINGEDWDIIGEPETNHSSTNPRLFSTVINISKEGT